MGLPQVWGHLLDDLSGEVAHLLVDGLAHAQHPLGRLDPPVHAAIRGAVAHIRGHPEAVQTDTREKGRNETQL
jgi:hypothetical protein